MRVFETILSSRLRIRVLLAAATVTCLLLGLVVSSVIAGVGIVVTQSWRITSPFEILLVELIISGICLLWAPLGAHICARIARNRGLPVKRYAVAGATYSILFFFPWLYLIMLMHNKTVWKPAIWAAYVILYAGWLLGPIMITLFLAALSVGTLNDWRSPVVLLSTSLSLTMILAWCTSLFLLFDSLLPSGRFSALAQTGEPMVSLIARVHIAPFILCFSSIAGLFLAIGGVLSGGVLS
jgi:multisubunit Na+/H+ antiporter MnhG subunit